MHVNESTSQSEQMNRKVLNEKVSIANAMPFKSNSSQPRDIVNTLLISSVAKVKGAQFHKMYKYFKCRNFCR